MEWTSKNAWRDSFIGESKINGNLDIDNNTIGLWHFDKTENATMTDSSGNKNHGTIHEAKWCEGRFGNGLDFNGKRNYVEIPNSDSLDLGTNLSMEATISFNEYGHIQPILGKLSLVSNNDEYGIYYTTNLGKNELHFVMSDGATRKDSRIKWTPNIGQWYHIAGTYDGQKARLYIDGFKVSEIDYVISKINDKGNNLFFGRDVKDNFYFSGKMDEVRISDFTRTPEEIRHSYLTSIAIRGGEAQLSTEGYNPGIDPNCIGYWSFDESGGNIANDGSSNENDGTLKNNPTWIAGINRGALEFDGINDYIEVQDNNKLEIKNGEFTIEAWIYPKSYPTTDSGDFQNTIVGKWNNVNSDRSFTFTLGSSSPKDAESLIFLWSNDGNQGHNIKSNKKIPLNVWSYVLVMCNDSHISLYINQ